LRRLDLKTSIPFTLERTHAKSAGHQDERKVAGAPGLLRGLTAHEETAPMAEVFGDDE
jgi:hypothetical protein